MKSLFTAAAAATILFAAGCSSSGGLNFTPDLYVVDGADGYAGFVYAIDLESDPWTVQIVGQIEDEDGNFVPLTGIAAAPDGTVYATTPSSAGDLSDLFLTVDLETGTAEYIDYSGDTDCIYGVNDLAFAGDTLYGVTGEDNTNCIITIDEDGEVTETDTNDTNGGALAYDGSEDILYYLNTSDYTDPAGLDTIDLDDGTIVTGDVEVDDDGLDDVPYDSGSMYIKGATVLNGRLILLVGYYYGSPSYLLEVDTDTGDVTNLGPVPAGTDAIMAIR